MKHVKLFEGYINENTKRLQPSEKAVMKLWQFLSPDGRKELFDDYEETDHFGEKSIPELCKTEWPDLSGGTRMIVDRWIRDNPEGYKNLINQEDYKEFHKSNESKINEDGKSEDFLNENNIDENKIKSVAEDAQEAFWSVVADRYSEMTSGDFPPDATLAFDAACKKAVKVWVISNTETEE